MSDASAAQPATMPAAVAALGKPERIYQTSNKRVTGMMSIGGLLCGLAAIGFFAIAGLFFYFLYKPFGQNPPPQEVALGAGIGCTIVALGFLGGAIWCLGPGMLFGRNEARAYLVFDKVLVELFADHHRIIPWDDIGPQSKPTAPLAPVYCFPVRNGEELRFDYTIGDHEKLVQNIKRRAGERVALANLGAVANLQTLASATPGPAFIGRVSAVFSGGHVFRICTLGKSLVFIKVADAYPVVVANPAGGLAGGIAAYAQMKRLEEFKKRLERIDREARDSRSLLQLVGEFDGSFVAGADELSNLSLDPPAGWGRLFSGVKCSAMLNLVHATRGAMKLELISPQDLLNAKDELQGLFGDAIKVNVSWRDV